MKLAFVGYHDYQVGFCRIQNLDFREHIDNFKEFVGIVEATGGDDVPEDVPRLVGSCHQLKMVI